ncbi:MAG: antibiotic biosynthesis monooxygenase [Campylobacterales bacterium]|nr:antibiotic biosynthesis monooxygenase [Campylobacterales bacterium]
MSKVILVVKIEIKDEYLDQIENQLKELHRGTHKYDRGCIQYDYHKDTENKNTYFFVETWESQEALDEHKTKEHFTKFFANTQDMISNIEINRLEKLGE